jgi:hypothetical protein
MAAAVRTGGQIFDPLDVGLGPSMLDTQLPHALYRDDLQLIDGAAPD